MNKYVLGAVLSLSLCSVARANTVNPEPPGRGKLLLVGQLSVDPQAVITKKKNGKVEVESQPLSGQDDSFQVCNLEGVDFEIDSNKCAYGNLNKAMSLGEGDYEIFFNNSRAQVRIESGVTKTIQLTRLTATALAGSTYVELYMDAHNDLISYSERISFDETDFRVGTFERTGSRRNCVEKTKVSLSFPPSVYTDPVCTSKIITYTSAQSYFLVLPGLYRMHWVMSEGGDVEKTVNVR